MFAVLEFQDFGVIAFIVCVVSGTLVSRMPGSMHGKRLRRLESKVDAIIQHLKIELPPELLPVPLSEKVRHLADRGQKIEAIKAHREDTGSGLKEAKEDVEAYLGD